MTPEEAKKFPKYKGNPLFAGLSDYVKDHKNFMPIQRALMDCLAVKHSHSELIQFTNCKDCQNKLEEFKRLRIKLGFTTPAIYYAWKKTHEKIKEMMPLQYYNK